MPASGKDSDSGPAQTNGNGAALERERWLRDRFDNEHQVTLAMMRLLVGGRSEKPGVRFWRWLIDDYRSERRLLELSQEGWDDRLLISRLRSWFGRRGATNRRDPTGANRRRKN